MLTESKTFPADAILTYTGRVVRPLDPGPETINIMDIAHALSNQCRFTGHTKEFYSVAQHSVYVSMICHEEDAMWGLLHDASEAYLSDIARPVKKTDGFGNTYRTAESKLMRAIAERYLLTISMPESVKKADDLMLWAEGQQLMGEGFPVEGRASEITIQPWSPKRAKFEFLDRYEELM